MSFSDDIITAFEGRETPFYYYDMNLLRETLDYALKEASQYGYHIHYALKANSNPVILKEISARGFGADCVSGGEIKRALENGFSPDKIVYAGVGKTDAEIRTGLNNNIYAFNSESLAELRVIDALAAEAKKTAFVALRINPDVDARTHRYITTGLDENKFGISMTQIPDAIDLLSTLNHVKLTGLHFHIGSQITDMQSFRGLCLRINEIQQWFIDRHVPVDHINVGGGLGINYESPDKVPVPDFASFFRLFYDHLELHPGQTLHFEPGRSLVGQCGSLISRVLYVKSGINKEFAILDAGMSELLRPALYQAYHRIEHLTKKEVTTYKKYDVVGPVCESSDTFGKHVELPLTARGDLIAIRSAGAYGEVMASAYNLRNYGVHFVTSDELQNP